MRCYIPVQHFTPDAPPFPAGTPAFDDPAAALEAARAARAELIYLYNAAVVDGLTVKELCPRHPARVYPTRRTVLHYDGMTYRLKDTAPDAPKAPTTQRHSNGAGTHTAAHSTAHSATSAATAHSASTTTTHHPPAPRRTPARAGAGQRRPYENTSARNGGRSNGAHVLRRALPLQAAKAAPAARGGQAAPILKTPATGRAKEIPKTAAPLQGK